MVQCTQGVSRNLRAGRVSCIVEAVRVVVLAMNAVAAVLAPPWLAAPALGHPASSDECEPSWSEGLFCVPGVNFTVRTALTWDDGTGEALYVGGLFSVAGCTRARSVVRWDGTTWTALGEGVPSTVYALAVFDDGLGGGPALCAGGQFTTAGGAPAAFIARWDGTTWSPLGEGMNGRVNALTVHDDGTGRGPALYAAGQFTTAGGIPASRIARWDGSTWSPVSDGIGGVVHALNVFDDGSGSGPALYAGGTFGTAGGMPASRIARWDGSTWSPLSSGVDGAVSALAVIDHGTGDGPVLYAGGGSSAAGFPSAHFVARWDGSDWSPLGAGTNGPVNALTVYDDGAGGGPALYAGGSFDTAGGVPANRIARWDGSGWSPLGAGILGSVRALAVIDDDAGAGPALYAGGIFGTAGGTSTNFVARWDGTTWSALGTGLNGPVHALAFFDDGSGNGPALYAGGHFTSAGGVSASRIARWDGTSWSALGSGTDYTVRALAVFDDGSGNGPSLYVGGEFTMADGIPSPNIARWDGLTWSALDSAPDHWVYALTVFDDGTGGGPALYAGGDFTAAGGVSARSIARWDGSAWSALGSGLTDGGGTGTHVYAMSPFADGRGGAPALFAGGGFGTAGGSPSHAIARWQACPPRACPADLTQTGAVGIDDLVMVLDAWGTDGSDGTDLTDDGVVGFQDVLVLLAAWGPCP
ncbi:MAG: hypothetical protein KF817_13345 [Phycisphaeraceae bacterium]|nr:hypothetical protein [Phycisphaeraceae bacterium]